MVNEGIKIANFMGEAFLHIWPYLLVTIPLAVAVNMSGASKFIKRAFDARPITAILLATLVGAWLSWKKMPETRSAYRKYCFAIV
jgi:hypothetical protein